jgi:hypothetical protein
MHNSISRDSYLITILLIVIKQLSKVFLKLDLYFAIDLRREIQNPAGIPDVLTPLQAGDARIDLTPFDPREIK